MKEIKLTQGKVAIVDDEDYEELSKHKWFYSTHGYAVRNSSWVNGKRTMIWMHRVINKTPDGFDTDHIDGNKIDNRKGNIRTVTRQQNIFNSCSTPNTSSRYKGVYYQIDCKKWRAQIRFLGRIVYLGLFKSEAYAAMVYNNFAKEYFGEYARLNVING